MGRSFHPDWCRQFAWLQYFVLKDTAFCYACMQFQPHGTKETSFMETGFTNWKNALDKCGFPKHEKSETHICTMSMWKERENHVETCTSVSTLMNETALVKRYYVKSIMEVIQFLAVNELAL